MSISVRNLTRLYGKQKAVDDISFEIGRGQVVGFIGPNGAGKSTTMKILTGILPADRGEAFINGLSVKKETLRIKQMVGYLPENNPLYPEMYVREYLEYVRDLYSLSLQESKKRKSGRSGRIAEVIEMTGLGPEAHKKIMELSKGYRQRVGLAQAIIHDPDVLILDEPTSGLDPGQIIWIRNLIQNLGKNKTVLLSTHLMQEVEAICDRVILINKGKIVADGSPGEISKSGTGNVETILLELDTDTALQKIENLPGVLRCLTMAENRYLIESESDNDIRPALFQLAVAEGLTILSLQKKEKTLEEVFQDLTK